jgi:hypothetical protein
VWTGLERQGFKERGIGELRSGRAGPGLERPGEERQGSLVLEQGEGIKEHSRGITAYKPPQYFARVCGVLDDGS